MATHPFSTAKVATLLLLCGLVPIVESCSIDPVHDQEVVDLGGEIDTIPVGEYHRAGQPCTVCHGPEGPAATQFSMAGTIFDSSGSLVGLGNVQVLLVDALGTSPPQNPLTNCVGNFFISPDVWTPSYPVLVGLQSGKIKTSMTTQISRASSCAECHVAGPASYDSVGQVYISASPNPKLEMACPVSNDAAADSGAL
jgi:hypothetical protein